MKIIILFIFILIPTLAMADSIEFTTGVSYTKYDDYSDYDDYGVSAKFRYLRYNTGQHGFFINADFPAEPFFMANLLGGYGIKSKGPLFFEAGAGFFYGPIWGTGVGVVVGTGVKFGKWYFSLPVTYRSGIAIEITPLIGYSF